MPNYTVHDDHENSIAIDYHLACEDFVHGDPLHGTSLSSSDVCIKWLFPRLLSRFCFLSPTYPFKSHDKLSRSQQVESNSFPRCQLENILHAKGED